MVRLVENPKRVEAACCNVEVVNGGLGLLVVCLDSISLTL